MQTNIEQMALQVIDLLLVAAGSTMRRFSSMDCAIESMRLDKLSSSCAWCCMSSFVATRALVRAASCSTWVLRSPRSLKASVESRLPMACCSRLSRCSKRLSAPICGPMLAFNFTTSSPTATAQWTLRPARTMSVQAEPVLVSQSNEI